MEHLKDDHVVGEHDLWGGGGKRGGLGLWEARGGGVLEERGRLDSM